MKKLIAVAIAALFLAATAAIAADAPKGPVKVTNFGKKDAVSYDHAKHGKIDCKTCHHKEGNDFKCGTCHQAEAGKAPSIKDAFHDKANAKGACFGCHDKSSATVKKELKCADCHKG